MNLWGKSGDASLDLFTLQRIDGKPIFGDDWRCETRDQSPISAERDTVSLTGWLARCDIFRTLDVVQR